VLLDQLLIAAGADPHTVTGPELTSHLEVALAVASGIADTALGLRATITDLGLESSHSHGSPTTSRLPLQRSAPSARSSPPSPTPTSNPQSA